MTVDTAIRDRLLDCSPVTALVVQRVYVEILPQHPVFPAIRLQRVSQIEPMHLRGPVGTYRARVQVDSIASTKAGAETIDAAVQGDGLGTAATGLKGWRGSTGSPGLTVASIEPAGVRSGYDPDELRLFRIMRDFTVTFEGEQ